MSFFTRAKPSLPAYTISKYETASTELLRAVYAVSNVHPKTETPEWASFVRAFQAVLYRVKSDLITDLQKELEDEEEA